MLTQEEKRLFNRLNKQYTENEFLEFLDFYNIEYSKNYTPKSNLTNEQIKDLKENILNKINSFNGDVTLLNNHLKSLKGTELICTVYTSLTESNYYSEEFEVMIQEYGRELRVIRKLDLKTIFN